MKNLVQKNFDTHYSNISLQLLVDELVNDLLGNILLNKIVVENEVSANLSLRADQNEVMLVINELLATVVANARDTSINITAEKFSDIVTLRVEDRNNFNGYALSFSLLSIGRKARCLGGDINIRGAQKRVATVSFSFPDSPQVKEYSCRALA